MIVATFLVVFGICSFILRIVEALANKTNNSLWTEMFMITIGLSYLIWYCN